MDISQKLLKVPFVDYIPAELRENDAWRIVYYVIDPYQNILKRKRKRVKPLKSITERRKLGKRMVMELNNRLQNGWNPLLGSKGVKELTKLSDTIAIYLRNLTIEYNDGNLSFDTLRTYKSRLTVLEVYLKENRMQ